MLNPKTISTESAGFNSRLQHYQIANRDGFFHNLHASYLANMSFELYKCGTKHNRFNVQNYCSSIMFANMAYESIGNVIYRHTQGSKPSQRYTRIDEICKKLEKNPHSHQNKLELCNNFLSHLKNYLIPNTQLYQLLPHMKKIKELILYVNHWTLNNRNTPIWLGSFLSSNDLNALATCFSGNLYLYIQWINHQIDLPGRPKRSYLLRTTDEIWNDFSSVYSHTHTPINYHILTINEFIDDLIIVLNVLFDKTTPQKFNSNKAAKSFANLTKRSDMSEGIDLHNTTLKAFLWENPTAH